MNENQDKLPTIVDIALSITLLVLVVVIVCSAVAGIAVLIAAIL